MSFQEAIQSVFQKYICFSGRARRSEYGTSRCSTGP